MLRPKVSRPVRPHLGPKTRFMLLSDSCGFVAVERSLWPRPYSVICVIYCIYNFYMQLTCLVRVRCVALARTAQKTQFPTVYCCVRICCRENCLFSRYLAMDGAIILQNNVKMNVLEKGKLCFTLLGLQDFRQRSDIGRGARTCGSVCASAF
jgi:hypothetical protein